MATEVIDHDTHEQVDASKVLELRRPSIPTSLAELAALKGEAVEIIEARIRVLETARKAAIRATHPEDWLLFKAPDDQGGQIVGYLQDSGCERVRDIFGISISNVSSPEKISAADPGEFHYVVRGDGHCTLTAQMIEAIEGGRSSTEDFCKDKTGAALELAVRKAARANLDGQIVRELAGLAGVPSAELEAAWTGTHKVVDRCRRGRGFGSRNERLGANTTRGGAPDVEPPVCPHCNAKGVYRPGKDGRGAFYGCPNYAKHSDKKFIVNADEWVAKQQAAAPKPAQSAAASAAKEPPAPAGKGNGAKPAPPLQAGDIFREPGSDD
jgi:hypothetical protein